MMFEFPASAWQDAMRDMRSALDMRSAGDAGGTSDYMTPEDVADMHALSFPPTPAGDAAFAAYISAVNTREVATRAVHDVRPPFPAPPALPAHQAATWWGHDAPAVSDTAGDDDWSPADDWRDYQRDIAELAEADDARPVAGGRYPSRADMNDAARAAELAEADDARPVAWSRTVYGPVLSDDHARRPAVPYHYAMHHGLGTGQHAGPSAPAAPGCYVPYVPRHATPDSGRVPREAPAVPLAGFPSVDSAPDARRAVPSRARRALSAIRRGIVASAEAMGPYGGIWP